MSKVTCHVSCVTCHMSHVTCHMFFFFFSQSGEASLWKVCYQRGLPRLVLMCTCTYSYIYTCIKVLIFTCIIILIFTCTWTKVPICTSTSTIVSLTAVPSPGCWSAPAWGWRLMQGTFACGGTSSLRWTGKYALKCAVCKLYKCVYPSHVVYKLGTLYCVYNIM